MGGTMDETRRCQWCDEEIRLGAVVCRYCGRDQRPLASPVPLIDGLYLSHRGDDLFLGRDERREPHAYVIADPAGLVTESFPADVPGWEAAWASFSVKVGTPRQVVPPEGRLVSEDVKRKLVASLAQQGKYRKALQTGDLAMISIMGTESWSEYAQTVVQVLMLDTLMGLERELSRLNEVMTSSP
jgi:hypothetical protein